MKQFTATGMDEVRCWVETVPHHKSKLEFVGTPSWKQTMDTPATHITLSGHFETMRIPVAIHKECFLKAGGEFDCRMFRWDHESEKNHRSRSVPERTEKRSRAR